MKKLIAFLCFIGLLHGATMAQSRTYEQATKILPAKMEGLDYSAKDVQVYQAAGGYAVEFYAIFGQHLKLHKFIVQSAKPYNMANFTWETDNMLIMQFSYTDAPNKMVFRLTANSDGTSAIEIIEPE